MWKTTGRITGEMTPKVCSGEEVAGVVIIICADTEEKESECNMHVLSQVNCR